MPADVKADFDSLEQAAHWYAALHGGAGSPEQHDAWSRWLHEKPEHHRAWRHIEAVSLRLAPLRGEGERDAAVVAIEVSAKRRHGRRQALRGLAVLGAGGLAGWLAWRSTALQDVVLALNADHRTGTGELRDFTLADGTRVWLNTGSAVDVEFDQTRRLLTLRRGEILVDTGHDAQDRPFYVATRFGRLQALGTRFAVRQEPGHVLLAVFEGRVLVRNLAGQEEVVPAGSQRIFSDDSIGPEDVAERARQAWSRGVILAEDIRLDVLLSEVGRYQLGHLGVDPRVAGLRVVGRYPANNPEQTLAMLERDLPIRVRRVLPWWITLEPR
jgi:transmembrane sensor